MLFNLPYMQGVLANWIANALSDKIGSEVKIGSVNIGFLNRIIINDIEIKDLDDEEMLKVARISTSLNVLPLLQNKIDISTAQLFGAKAKLYKETKESTPNYQFLVDAFKSKEEKPSTIDLNINSLIMRHIDVTYDVRSEAKSKGLIDVNHIAIDDFGININLKCFTNDSLNITVKRLQATEKNSGISLNNTKFSLVANRQQASLYNVELNSRHSSVSLDSVNVNYSEYEKNKEFCYSHTLISANVIPSDFYYLSPILSSITSPIACSISTEGSDKEILVNSITVNNDDKTLLLKASGNVKSPLQKSLRTINCSIETLNASSETIKQIAEVAELKESIANPIFALGNVYYKGNVIITPQTSILEGYLKTDAGAVEYDVDYGNDKLLIANIKTDSLNIGKILDDEKLSTVGLDVHASANLASSQSGIPNGNIEGQIKHAYYNGYRFHSINLDVTSNNGVINGDIDSKDENMLCDGSFTFDNSDSHKGIKLNLAVNNFSPNKIKLTDSHIGETLALDIDADVAGSNFENMFGYVSIHNLNYRTPQEDYIIDHIQVKAEKLNAENNFFSITSDVLNGEIRGKVSLTTLVPSITNQLARHIPILVKPQSIYGNYNYDYDFVLTDAPILHHFVKESYSIPEPVTISGSVSSANNEMQAHVNAPKLIYSEKPYDDIALHLNSAASNLHLTASAQSMPEEEKMTSLSITSNIHSNKITADVNLFTQNKKNNIKVNLLPTIQLSDSLGSLNTNVHLSRSNILINDTIWNVYPSTVSIYKNGIDCQNVKIANSIGGITINGKATPSPNDSIIAELDNIELRNIMDLINFHVVRFTGLASGRAVVNNVLGGGIPDFKAKINVKDLTIHEGPLGDANISAWWDKSVDGISTKGEIVDVYDMQDALTGNMRRTTGITSVNGWISPGKKDLKLNVNTHNTNAKFLHGFLRGVFSEIDGCVTGPIAIEGPFNDVDVIGDALPNLNLRLKATNVPYHIEGDTLRFREHEFIFKDITISDRFGNRGMVDGLVTHTNMKNFKYDFDVKFKNVLAYDEKKFNPDKFKATVFVDGNLGIHGSDGHPIYVNADVTPTRGSEFAYDAATPDAIGNSNFLTFNDRDSLALITSKALTAITEETPMDSLSIVKEAKKNYVRDIFINFNINLTPACAVNLRMDNIEDGYMRTYGYAKLTAKWYNKGAFQLFGNYNIQSGSYRLYLHDIIFRDLALQQGSSVEFNGNPFDANIHLICHHTLNSVPLSDLTATTAFSQNNKVKVNCILDITGKLGNMDFKFDMNIPNVSEEVRQLVRSMINSEEEMNTQMIYLLGLGRFYPNEFARSNGQDNNSGQAMNSLLSSTLSGQINQMLSNAIGRNSNWNFGTGLTTGEKGWEDLDVEGILSGNLLNDRLLINGNFGYRDNAMTNTTNFIGDFEVKWRTSPNGNLFVKAYNQTNDRYFTKATLNTQGVGISFQHNFEGLRSSKSKSKKKEKKNRKQIKNKARKYELEGVEPKKE